MSQQVRVERELKFAGSAANRANIEGRARFKNLVFYDDFDRIAIDSTNRWACNTSHGGTVAIAEIAGGAVRLSASTTDDDKAEMATPIIFSAQYGAAVLWRIKVDAITTVKINAGFADAKSQANDLTAFAIDGTTIVDTATDGVCWVFDTDATNDYWYMCNTKAGTQAGTSAAVAPVAAAYEDLMISLDSSGHATFYRNGVPVGYKANAVTAATLLCAYLAVQSMAGSAARVLDAQKCYVWMDPV